MNGRFLLDTNTISTIATDRSAQGGLRLADIEPNRLCASVISYGEIWFGLFRRPAMSRLRETMERFLAEIEILPWSVTTATIYAQLRADMERIGKPLAPLDMLIAAHALEAEATLVTSDRAFRFVPGLAVEDWTA